MSGMPSRTSASRTSSPGSISPPGVALSCAPVLSGNVTLSFRSVGGRPLARRLAHHPAPQVGMADITGEINAELAFEISERYGHGDFLGHAFERQRAARVGGGLPGGAAGAARGSAVS